MRRSRKEKQSRDEIAAFLQRRTGIEIDRPTPKFGNRRVTVDGIRFPSALQAGYFVQRIRPQIESGGISLCLHEVPVPLVGGKSYRIDFVLFYADGGFEFVEAKGYETELWRLKAAVFVNQYRIPLTVAFGEYQGGLLRGFRIERLEP